MPFPYQLSSECWSGQRRHAAPLLLLGQQGWLPVCIPHGALKGLRVYQFRWPNILDLPGPTQCDPAALATLLIALPFCHSQKSSTADDKFKWPLYQILMGLPRWLSGKESACKTGDSGSTPGSGRSPGGGHGNPLQYHCLESPMDRGAWRTVVHEVAKSWTQLKRLSTHIPNIHKD